MSSSLKEPVRDGTYFYDRAYSKTIPVYPNESVVVFAHRHLEPGQHVLDLGCGAGRHSLMMAEHGQRITAQDITRVGLAHLQEKAVGRRLPVSTVHRCMREIDFEPSTFDAVVAWGSIYHVTRSEIAEIIRSVERILVPGGYFLVSFKGLLDFQRGQGDCVEENTWRLPEKDLLMHFTDRAGVEALLGSFELVSIETERSTLDNGSKWVEQHVATVRKPV